LKQLFSGGGGRGNQGRGEKMEEKGGGERSCDPRLELMHQLKGINKKTIGHLYSQRSGKATKWSAERRGTEKRKKVKGQNCRALYITLGNAEELPGHALS